jgi:outer membrane protein OmpA-like peptidoglycan-associated protein
MNKQDFIAIPRNSMLSICLMMSLSLSGCKTLDPYSGESKINKTTQGAAIGAAAGAVIGVLTGDGGRERRRNALIGAGLGALSGGAVGYYMDRQEAALRQQLASSGVSVTRHGDQIILNMPGNITFDIGSADISANFFRVLNGVSLVVKEYDKTLIEVVGHSDSTGRADYNQALSEQRAHSVSEYIISQGIVAERLGAYGYGEDYPIADNNTAIGRSLNRRVEIVLLPITR